MDVGGGQVSFKLQTVAASLLNRGSPFLDDRQGGTVAGRSTGPVLIAAVKVRLTRQSALRNAFVSFPVPDWGLQHGAHT